MVRSGRASERTALRPNPDGSNGGKYSPPRRRKRRIAYEESAQDASPELSGEGEHFIDFTA